ncbi:MAG TPA: helix-turn-helix domain-containing protein [Rhodanobacteraceae bacterium]|nr:helix-turn-helix domain-containing protein [Rhodanobacteraceae bacterium]
MVCSTETAQERIVAVAQRLFAQHGFDGVSINDIAAAAGVSKANVFHHAASKAELYDRVLQEACAVFTEGYERLAALPGDFRQRLVALIEWHARHLREQPQAARLVLRELTAWSEKPVQGPADRCIGANLLRVQRLLEADGIATRPTIDAAFVTRVLLAVSWFRFQTQHLEARVQSRRVRLRDREFAEQLADLLLHGMLRAD